ncbi:MAG: DNA ligase-associated DEXH box helicase [Isosphaeraceae bacterium]|jgi:putative mRNA 3-end processing factor|nr:MAG: DNA ligase-associated DEXH box helicase [Isosphaeraceae bacterium]
MECLIEVTDHGLYCAAGDFYIDPWRPVPRAIITHAHADHACRGCGRYLTTSDGLHVLRTRLGEAAVIDTLDYGRSIDVSGVRISLHPAGHLLGSAQIRLERQGRVEVVSGDYKTESDPTCQPFEPIRCHTFLTESTFGLPIYRWRPWSQEIEAINGWWQRNADEGFASVIFAYALGKAQRVLSGLNPAIGPIVTHGAVEALVRAYRATGVSLPPTRLASSWSRGDPALRRAIVLAPPSAQGSPWLNRFGAARTAFASGWMRIRGARRRRAVDRGFVVSDHADWPGLIGAIRATSAELILVTHGYAATLARWLNDQGQDARPLQTRYVGERPDDEVDEPEATLDDPPERDGP